MTVGICHGRKMSGRVLSARRKGRKAHRREPRGPGLAKLRALNILSPRGPLSGADTRTKWKVLLSCGGGGLLESLRCLPYCNPQDSILDRSLCRVRPNFLRKIEAAKESPVTKLTEQNLG
jgi:hypothetical protein